MSRNKTFIRNFKRLFEAISFQRLFLLMLFISTVCVFAAKAEEKRKTEDDSKSPIPLEWEGEYSGIQGFVKIRKMIMTIYPFSKGDKDIKGEISIFPSNPMDVDGLYGSYYFQGSYDDETGEITVQGNEWIAYPVDIYGQLYEGGLGFVLLQGIVDKVSNEIIGTSDHGIWQLTAKNDALFMCEYLTESVPIFLQKGKWANNTGKDISLKLSYKEKDGTFKGSFKVSKQKAIVNGVVVDGVGYGSAVIKNAGFMPVVIDSVKEE